MPTFKGIPQITRDEAIEVIDIDGEKSQGVLDPCLWNSRRIILNGTR